MSVPLTINGVTFQYPQQFDTNWGPTLTNWSTAVTNALMPITGGTLSVPNNQAGVQWRNFANNAYLPLTVNTSNQLTFNGTPIGATVSLTDNHIFVGNASNQPTDVAMSGDVGIVASGATTIQSGAITNSKVNSAAAIALSKLASSSAYYWYTANASGVLTPLAVSPSLAVLSDSNGLPTTGLTTATEIGYVHGVTSDIQTQFNTLSSTFLPLTGGTMSGPINMGNNIITGLTQGTSSGQALAFPISSSFGTFASSFGFTNRSIASFTINFSSGLLILSYSFMLTAESGFSNNPVYYISIFDNGTEISGGCLHRIQSAFTGGGVSVTEHINMSASVVIVPSVGAHTYSLSANARASAIDGTATVSDVTFYSVNIHA